MLEQVPKVKIFRTNGCSSPRILQIFAICMTGSWSGVGNLPESERHSISKDRIRRGGFLR